MTGPDLTQAFGAVEREYRTRTIAAGEARSIVIRREFAAPIEDVWAACTEPGRIDRWFLPVSGDLRLGGTFQIEGNAHGEILRCEPPRLLRLSWSFFDREADEVELRLAPAGPERARFELEHASLYDVFLNDPESGMWGVGSGWELPINHALSRYLAGELPDAPSSEWFEFTPEVSELANDYGRIWAGVVRRAAER